jgi:hypothetical protein
MFSLNTSFCDLTWPFCACIPGHAIAQLTLELPPPFPQAPLAA